jgi:PII-like signaling protein
MGMTMQLPRDAVLLRIFFGEDDKFEHLPLYEAIVLKAREMHLAGVEIVDSKEKIDTFLSVLDGMMSSGLVTLEKVQVLQYGAPSSAPA